MAMQVVLTPFSLTIGVLSLIVLFRLTMLWLRHSFSTRIYLIWSSLWIIGALVVFVPEITNGLAGRLGLVRGTDLVLYSSIIALLYLILSLYQYIKNIDYQLTRFVREEALRDSTK
jgi:hypothetical protein